MNNKTLKMDILQLKIPEEAALLKLLNGNVSAIIFDNIVDELFISKVINNINDFDTEFYRAFNGENAFSIPMMFGQLLDKNNEEDKKKYFSDVKHFEKEWREKINFDFSISKLLSPYFKPFSCEVLEGFLPFSLRVLHAQKGGLSTHKDEDLFEYVHPEVAEAIKEKIIPETMMSWFITIQNTEKGGKLNVLPKEFNFYKKINENTFLDTENKEITTKDLPFKNIDITERSLILFNGGDFWHQVSAILGEKDRITLGGFWAMNKAKNKVLIWS